MHIHHVGGVAVTANSPGNAYEGLVFRRNHIHHTSGHGEGFYLGCNNKSDGSTAGYMFNSLVEQNYIHDLNGPNISQGDGVEIKDGSYNNIVRDNVLLIADGVPPIRYNTDATWLLDGARGDVPVNSTLEEIVMGRDAIRILFDIEVLPVAGSGQ
jgi:hypothetical protein